MLDLRLLHQALTLASYRHFARAAAALQMTQPALSRSIAGLEATLGEQLFNRTRQGVEPTAFGELLLARGRSLLDAAHELERDFSRMRGLELGELRVGAGAYPAELSVGRAVGRLLERHPKLCIDVRVGDLRALLGALLSAELELAVIELSLVAGETRVLTEPLPRHQGVFYCRAGHPLCAEDDPPLESILTFPFAGTRLPARVAKSFLEMARAGTIDSDSGDYIPPVKADSFQAAKAVVLASDAVGAAPLPMIAADIEAGRLVALSARLPWLHTGYGFVYLRERTLSPAAQAFISELRQVETELAELDAARPSPSRFPPQSGRRRPAPAARARR